MLILYILGWFVGAMITAKILFQVMRSGPRNIYTGPMDGFVATFLSLIMWPLIAIGLMFTGLCFGMCKLLKME